MSFKNELLELKRQTLIAQRKEVQEIVENLFRENKDNFEDRMKMSAKSGYSGSAYLIPPEKLENHPPIVRKRITEQLCVLLDKEYPGINFEAYSQGEISIKWEE